MAKPPDSDDQQGNEGVALWHYVTRTIRPLQRDDRLRGHEPPALRPKRKKTAAPAHGPETFASGRGAQRPMPAEKAGAPAGVDKRTEERLRRGQMPIDATIDLHGMTAIQARLRLERFLQTAQARGHRCVLVITGKGGRLRPDSETFWPEPGILRRSLGEWLTGPPLGSIVLRYFPAKGRHGGSGAFYVLLRRER